ncbi:EAL domain-containing protein [Bacillus sp. CGMCC 1.16607]|uniref:EAL domain-containing protein n=1 Tax=Bacillus sp. CGMCC 1.16607 TaxID=3351842 RepID=UPI00364068C1
MNWKIEMRAYITIFIGLVLLLGTKYIGHTFEKFYDPNNFLSLHTLIEFLCISISFSIFIQGWMIFTHTLSKYRVMIALLFFVMGILDILHTLSYKGMPFFLEESSVERATWLWIISRVILSLGLFMIIYQKDKEITKGARWGLLSLTALLVISIGNTVFLWEDQLPILIDAESGPTNIKRILEYIISFIFLLTILIQVKRYRESKDLLIIPFILAITFSLYSELMFTVYKNVYDLDNLLGHLFKLAGYYFFMKGIFISTIKVPFMKEKEAKQALETNEKQLNTILSMIPTGITITDSNGSNYYANKAAETILNLSNEEIISREVTNPKWKLKTLDGIDFPEEEHVFHTVTKTKESVYDVKCMLDGEKRTVLSINAAPIFNAHGQIEGIINTLTDITEKVMAEKKIHSLAYEDELTGLPNRHAFIEKVSSMMDDSKLNINLSLLLININRFKNVNDTLGTEIGDFVLKVVAERLRLFDHSLGFIARIGPDEFVIMTENKSDMKEYAKKLVKVMEEPIRGEELKFHISVSIGITSIDKYIGDEEFITQANIALAEAKKSELPFVLFDPNMSRKLLEKVALENDLRRAINQEELSLYYQPQVNSCTGKMIGVEALVRWNHPENGIVSPGKFIPIAEETGLIVPIGKWVINEACRQMKEWQLKGYPSMKISVNLSFRQFFQEDLIETVSDALQNSGLDPQFLELEITESMTINVNLAIKILNQLKELGVSIAVDDFGTGYSSLSYLNKYPIDLLKIDQSFIRNINIDKNYEVLLGTIISMAQHLNLELIAEGVETVEQVNFLKEKQCLGIQGYLISKPMTNIDFERFLEMNTILI